MTRAAHFVCAWGSRQRGTQSLVGFRRAVADARPLELIRSRSSAAPPWQRESLAAGLTHGWGSSDVRAVVIAEVTWPVLGTSLPGRVEAALRPECATVQSAALCAARLTHRWAWHSDSRWRASFHAMVLGAGLLKA